MGHVKVVQSGKILEMYEYEKEIQPKLHIRRKRKDIEAPAKRYKYRRSDNAKRMQKSFVRLVRANLVGDDRPALFTLTNYENVSFERGVATLTVFVSRLRKLFGKGFRYIAVPEFGRKNTQRLHFHVMMWGLPDDLVKNERYNRYFQNIWQAGYVDCISTDGSIKLAGYLGKYLSKSMFDDRITGKKAYSVSRNALRPVSLSFKTAISHSEAIWGVDLSTAVPLHSYEFGTKWLGKGRYKIFQI